MNNLLKVNDKIVCNDKEDAVNTMMKLAKQGIETDFDYSDGIALIVTKIEERN